MAIYSIAILNYQRVVPGMQLYINLYTYVCIYIYICISNYVYIYINKYVYVTITVIFMGNHGDIPKYIDRENLRSKDMLDIDVCVHVECFPIWSGRPFQDGHFIYESVLARLQFGTSQVGWWR